MPGGFRSLRYRIADRLGRFLVGGRLAALQSELDRLRSRAGTPERERSAAAADAEIGRLAREVAEVARRLDLLAARCDRQARGLDALRRERDAARRILSDLQERLRLCESTAAFALERDGDLRSVSAPRLRVSVVVPTRDRAELLMGTVASVLAQDYPNWQLVIVDDGSSDGTVERLEASVSDPRVRVVAQPGRGASAARNRALQEAEGDLIAYLDSDVRLYPRYLGRLASAFEADPDLRWSYSARLVSLVEPRREFLQFEPFDRAELERYNYIDTNVIAHRRGLERELGGWDESLVITADWDLALRWSAQVEPKALPLLACRYELGRPDQLTLSEPRGYDNFRVRSRHARRRDLGIRVLYAVAQYPQLTASPMEQEIRVARANGVHVEVWTFEPPEAPFSTDRLVHRGALAEAVAAARPDLLQVQGLDTYFQRGEDLRAIRLPIFVRGLGDELSEEKVDRLEADPAVSTVFLVPHFAELWSKTGKVVPAWAGFRPDLFYPGEMKDRRLVFRAAAGLPTGNLEALFDLAESIPELRFVLAVARAGGDRAWVEGLLERHGASGSPLQIQVDLRHEQVAELSRRAGIYLHTHSLEQPFSSPISIVEAMASGSYVLVPRCPPAERYAAEAADYYRDLDEAERLLRATLEWPDEEWRRRRRLGIDRAFDHFVADVAILPVLKCWLGALGRAWPG